MLTRLIYLVKIQILKNLVENSSLVSLIKSHYKSIFFLHSIILEFGCIFMYRFCKFLFSVIYDRNLWKMYTYTLLFILKKLSFQQQGLGGLVVMTPAFHTRDPGSNPWVGWVFFFIFFTYLNIFFNLRLNSWIMTA